MGRIQVANVRPVLKDQRGLFSLSVSGLGIVMFALAAQAAQAADAALGSRKNPIKLAMVPSAESTKILSNMAPVARCLEKHSGQKFDISVPNNYIVVVESLGNQKVDLAFLNTFGYLLANERYGSQALLKSVRYGETTYKGQIIVRANSGINSLADLNGKKIAYSDPASTSGHILPKKMLRDKNVKPASEVFAGKHDVVVTMVYQGQVDAGATYYSPKDPSGKIMDARSRVLTQFPDVEQKIKILELTEAIPNDPVVARKGLAPELSNKIRDAFIACIGENPEAFKGLNNSTGLAPVTDKEYDTLRATVKTIGIDLEKSLQ
jgi:phosphonate transport system substrate-binding protein